MAAATANRRFGLTRFFVPDPAFGWYVRGVALGAVTAALGFGALLWWYHGKLLDMLGLYELLDDPRAYDLIADYSRLSLMVTCVAVLGVALFVILMSIFFLHRIAGPIYRLKLHMMRIMEGETPRELAFRTDDQLADLAHIFNDLMRHLGYLEQQATSAVPVRSASGAAAGDAVLGATSRVSAGSSSGS